jgi:Ca-activated chloride channel family protein
MRWAFPWAFLAIPVLGAVFFWWRKRPGFRAPGLGFSATGWLAGRGGPPRWPGWFLVLGLLVLTVALARPQQGIRERELRERGVDIILAIDLSTSMQAEDLQPGNRLAVAKQVAEDFIQHRPHDRIGVVAFAASAFTQSPLTLNHDVAISLLRQLDFGIVEDGTAIGMGLATAVQRLRESKSPSKVTVLLTDGENNRGAIDPLTAADLARAMGVRVYTVLVGRPAVALDRTGVMQEVSVDDRPLIEIARRTHGRFFRAGDAASLASIYGEIDHLERAPIRALVYREYKDLGPLLLALAAILLAFHGWSNATWAFRVP